MKKKPGQKSVSIPILGKVEHNSGPALAIGGLIIACANNESVFMAMIQAFISGGDHSAAIVWHSLRTATARMELLERLAREQLVEHAELVKEIKQCIKAFKGLSRLRNFLAHGTYNYDKDLYLRSVTGMAFTEDGYPLTSETKQIDRATMNEIAHGTVEFAKLNQRLWAVVPKIEDALGVRRVKIPPLIRENRPSKDDHPDPLVGETRKEPDPPSRE